jgi:hypothetical protein
MTGNIATYTGGGLQPFENPEEARTIPVVLPGGVSYPQGQTLGLVPGNGTATNEVQTLTAGGTVSGGTYQLLWNGVLLPAAGLAYNAANATIQTQMDALVGAGNSVVGGGPLPGTPVTITFQGQLAGRRLPLIVVVSALTGTNPTLTPTRSTPGIGANGFYRDYASGNSDGSQVARALLVEACTTNPDGTIATLSGVSGAGFPTATAFVSGTFRGSDLTGFDSTALSGMNARVIAGIPGTLTDPTTLIRIP